MKKTLLASMLLLAVITSCRKEEHVNPYPIVYSFQKVDNVSDVEVFTAAKILNAPKHRTATADGMVHFQEYVITETSANTPSSITLVDGEKALIKTKTGTSSLPYVISGNYLIIANSMYFKRSDTGLVKTDVYAVISNTNYLNTMRKNRPANVSTVGTIQSIMNIGDTAAARSYDYVYRR